MSSSPLVWAYSPVWSEATTAVSYHVCASVTHEKCHLMIIADQNCKKRTQNVIIPIASPQLFLITCARRWPVASSVATTSYLPPFIQLIYPPLYLWSTNNSWRKCGGGFKVIYSLYIIVNVCITTSYCILNKLTKIGIDYWRSDWTCWQHCHLSICVWDK